MAKSYKMYLAGKWVAAKDKIRVESPYDNKLVGTVSSAIKKDYTKAIAEAHKSFEITRNLPSYARERICQQIADGIRANSEKMARMMSLEMGKAIKDARVEVDRSANCFHVAAEESKRIGGEITDLDWVPGSEERVALIRRFPVGVVAGISPFNFPLNLVAHKIAPAIAAGCPIVLKPASKTPIIALMLAEIIDKTDLPKGALSVLPGSSKESTPLIEDPRVKVITFTGSSPVGWWIKANSGDKRTVLELGGNAGVAVADDADVDFAVMRLVYGSFGQAGQSCISVQRIYVHEKVYDKFVRKFRAAIKKIKMGNPLNDKTDLGPMVDIESAKRTEEWIKEAVAGGAKLLAGGKRRNRMLQPTLLGNVKTNMNVCSQEVFAPLAVLFQYRDLKKVVKQINDSEYGLQAGVFTNRIKDIFYAYKYIECGGVIINDIPTYRVDHMPYGGVKKSGMGREGIKYGIEDMTEIKLLGLNLK
ncbi:MAG: aldehyde dehydrogenase family protein [candidate division Zixibacteria bacterium]|nr:aldehyde dehydrogenase family protein [candidate division Zixibacteria bacterium]